MTEYLLCCFATYLVDQNLTPQSISTYMYLAEAAVCNTQLSLGLPDPQEQSSFPILKTVQRGVSCTCLGHPQASQVRLPITSQVLCRVKSELERLDHPESWVLWVACCVAFFGFFHFSELLLSACEDFNARLHFTWGDVAVDNTCNPHMVWCHLKQSKTDQMGCGVDVVLGRTDRDLCPVAAVLGYIAHRGDRLGPFFLKSSGGGGLY